MAVKVSHKNYKLLFYPYIISCKNTKNWQACKRKYPLKIGFLKPILSGYFKIQNFYLNKFNKYCPYPLFTSGSAMVFNCSASMKPIL